MKAYHLTPIVLAIAAAWGCGGAGTPNVLTNPFTGSYRSTLTLDGGKPGVLDLAVSSTGSATGTLAVTSPAALTRDGSFTFSIGTHNVTGTVGSDGTISMTGTDNGTGAGDFSINGGLLSGQAGNVNIVAGGQTFTGTISATTGGGGGGGSLTLSNGVGTNANLTAFPSNPLVFMSTVAGASSIVASPSGGGNARTLSLLLLPEATPGTTMTFTGLQFNANSFIYGEDGTKHWLATAGTMTINSRTANTFSVTFNNVTMTAESDSDATGSFTMNGTFSK